MKVVQDMLRLDPPRLVVEYTNYGNTPAVLEARCEEAVFGGFSELRDQPHSCETFQNHSRTEIMPHGHGEEITSFSLNNEQMFYLERNKEYDVAIISSVKYRSYLGGAYRMDFCTVLHISESVIRNYIDCRSFNGESPVEHEGLGAVSKPEGPQ